MTNTTKFKVRSISKNRPNPIEIDDRIVPFANECSILGLKVKRIGIVGHLADRQVKVQSQKIKRFADLKDKTKLYLYKAVIRPVLEHPVIPNSLAFKTQLTNVQQIQNQKMRFIERNTEHRNKTMEQLQKHYNIEAINVRLYRQTSMLWNKFQL